MALAVMGATGCNGNAPDGNVPDGDVPNGNVPSGGDPAELDLVSGLGLIVDCDQNSGEGPVAGQQSLDFRFEDAAGATFSLSDFRGRMVLLNFWSTGCSHCAGEIPYIQQVYDQWPAEELVVLTIVVFNGAESVNTFFADTGFSLPVLLDSELELKEQYGVDELPYTLFIDKEGWIRGIKFGELESLEELEDILQQVVVLQEGG